MIEDNDGDSIEVVSMSRERTVIRISENTDLGLCCAAVILNPRQLATLIDLASAALRSVND